MTLTMTRKVSECQAETVEFMPIPKVSVSKFLPVSLLALAFTCHLANKKNPIEIVTPMKVLVNALIILLLGIIRRENIWICNNYVYLGCKK